MHARWLTMAAALLAAASAVPAEPVKTPAKPATQSRRPAPVILASADQLPAPAPSDQAAPPQVKPHRAARVTTCRCGGQTEQPEQ